MADLAGARVVVVGGSSGIGLAVALAARDEGAEVVVASRQPDRAAAELGEAKTVCLDVTDEASVAHAFEGIGPFDHLVCTAASGFPSGLMRAPEAEIRALMESKFWGPYRCSRAAAPLLRDGGSITFSSGIRSRRPQKGAGPFTVVNMAVEGMTKALALELAPLRVNAISPGTVDTPVFAGFTPEAREKHFERAAGQTTVGRVGTVDDIASIVVAVLANGFLTGTVLDVDGGGLIA
jgi:NAD(P)-dependent dehydrogenase (short-subunit alcohol dehydrogenase family)